MRSRTSKARPHVDALEDRTLLSTCHVTRLTDQGVGKGFRGDLRYCINKVNTEPGPDAIDFTVTGTINLTGALPSLSSEIDIEGPGADLLAIDAQEKDRVFDVTAGANVEISGVTVTNGLVWKGPFLALGGGIQNAGNLLVRGSAISGNRAHSEVYYGAGGGIYNAKDACLTVIDSIVSGNRVEGEEFAGGGGICNSGTASIYSSAIFDNVADDIANQNTGNGLGGGISNSCPPTWPPGGGGFLIVLNSTVHSNVSKGLDISSLRIGGISGGGGGTVIISHSTIAANTGWGVSAFPFMRDSIVAGNSDGDVYGSLASSGYNLIGDSEDGNGFADTDLLNVDPLLGPLADNGGPTLTVALLPGSPAIDAGDNTDAPEWDQRGPGFLRIVNGTIDIGAFEVQSSPIPPTRRPGFDLLAAVLATVDLDALTQRMNGG